MNRKNWLSALLAVMMVLSMLAVVALPAVAATTGLPEDADSVQNVAGSISNNFTLSSFEDLMYVAKNYNKFGKEDTIYFTADLNIADYPGDFAADFPGIGVSHDKPIKATIDGLGHTIYNYTRKDGFILGSAGDLRNLNFVGGVVDCPASDGYAGFVYSYCGVGVNSSVTISNVHVINATVNNAGTGSAAILYGATNNKSRTVVIENCSIINCTVNSPGSSATGAALLAGRQRDLAGSSLTVRNCLVAESTLICLNSADEGGGLIVGDGAMRGTTADTFVKMENVAAINNKQINTSYGLSGIMTVGSKFSTNIHLENIFANGNQRSTDNGVTWKPMTALADIKSGTFTLPTNYICDTGVTHLLQGKTPVAQDPVDGLTLHDMLGILTASEDYDDWGYDTKGNPAVVDVMKDQMVPHLVNIQFGDHRNPDEAAINETMYTSVNGTIIATPEQLKNLQKIPKGAIPGYESVTDWSTVVFTKDSNVGAILHDFKYTFDEVNHTHTAYCSEGCFANAENVPCSPILTGYSAATYFQHECADYTCEVCKNSWKQAYANGAVVSPFAMDFDAKTYEGGDAVKVRIGANANSNLNAFTAKVTFDHTALNYVSAEIGTNTADPSIVYSCNVRKVSDDELMIVAIIPDGRGTIYKDTWVTLNFAAKSQVVQVERADVKMEILSYVRSDHNGNFLNEEIIATDLTVNSYLLPSTGVDLNFTPGDIDGNGTIDIFDTLKLAKALRGEGALSSVQLKAANVDGDNVVTVADASLLLRYVVDNSIYLARSYVVPNM